MDKVRAMHYDEDLNIEASRFSGIVQNFPIHFHDYYTIGFIKSGEMNLTYLNKEYIVKEKSLVLFNPNDSHSCSDIKGQLLDFRSLNVSTVIMKDVVFEVTGENTLPHFNNPVNKNLSLISYLEELHYIISKGEKGFKKEELFLLVTQELIEEHCCLNAITFKDKPIIEINKVLNYIHSNYGSNITLNNLSSLIGFSKYHFIRSFTREVGITPYKYLETIRINNAKKLLKQGMNPANVALETGFTDQSHLNNLFKKLIGITPKQYMNMF